MSIKTAPLKAVSAKATSFKPASLESAVKVAIEATTVVASVRWVSPPVPGTCSNKDPVREPARTVVAVWCAIIRIVRVIAISADRRTSHIPAEPDAHSNSDLSLRIRKWQCQ
jgi:hypothetical protein